MRGQEGALVAKLDLAISGVLLTFLLVFLCISAQAIAVNSGLGSADDGFFALVSKSLAEGIYGLPQSSRQTSLFDPSVGSGPVLIGLGALVTLVFGPQDALGLSVLVFFMLQLSAVLVLLCRKYTQASVLGFGFASLFLLVVLSRGNWYFATFIGEVPAFGFVLLGVVLLASGSRRAWQVAAGISFSLAYLTKQITLFAVVGVIASWLVLTLRDRGVRETLAPFVALVAAFAALPILYELVKLATLGLDGYADLLGRTLQETAHMALGDEGNRGAIALERIRQSYGPVWVIATIALVGFPPLAWQLRAGGQRIALPVMLWAGTLVYFLYIVALSTLWARYFWIGAAMLVFACGSSLLLVNARLRWFVIGVLVIAFGSATWKGVDDMRKWSAASGLSAERAATLVKLEQTPTLPLAGRTWHSFYDIVYLMDTGRSWVTEKDLDLIRDREFVAILNADFGDKTTFYNAVTATCTPRFSARRYSLHLCGNPFWRAYGKQ